MAKTIKEIADELGVSKTAVSKQIANLGLRSSLRKNGNQFAIENQQEKLIKMAFQKKRQQEIVTENPVSDEQSQTKSQTANANQSQTANHEVCDLVGVLQTTVDTLQAQLAVKDEQIRELKAELKKARKEAELEKLRAHAYDTMINLAEERFNIPIRKKSGTKQ